MKKAFNGTYHVGVGDWTEAGDVDVCLHLSNSLYETMKKIIGMKLII
jgi:hypothetical protein